MDLWNAANPGGELDPPGGEPGWPNIPDYTGVVTVHDGDAITQFKRCRMMRNYLRKRAYDNHIECVIAAQETGNYGNVLRCAVWLQRELDDIESIYDECKSGIEGLRTTRIAMAI